MLKKLLTALTNSWGSMEDTAINILQDVVFVFLTYNQEKFISKTLTSAINQTYLPSTLIIMNDASPDNSDQVIKKIITEAPSALNIEYVNNTQNIGLIGQLNKLVNRFENKLIILQAGDDESYPNRIEETYKAWIDNNKPSLILANYDCINEAGLIIKKFDPKTPPEKAFTLDRIIRRRAKVYGCCAAVHSDLLNFFGSVPTNVINEDRINIFRAHYCRGSIYLHKALLKYNSEIGISAFKKDTKQQLVYKFQTEAKRELIDIESHFIDLQKVKDDSAHKMLLTRKKNVQWLSEVKTTLNFSQTLISVFRGVNISFAWKIYKKIKTVNA